MVWLQRQINSSKEQSRNLKINPHIKGQLIFDRGANYFNKEINISMMVLEYPVKENGPELCKLQYIQKLI